LIYGDLYKNESNLDGLYRVQSQVTDSNHPPPSLLQHDKTIRESPLAAYGYIQSSFYNSQF